MEISNTQIPASLGNILVTGATGLVGSYLTQQLVQQGKQVKALYRTAIPQTDWAKKVEWLQAGILNIPALEEALQNVQQVYHCAAIVSFNSKKLEALFKTNVEGTANVVNACITAGVQKLLFVSSVSALGRIRTNEVVTEEMHWTQETSNSAYGKSKYLAEMEVWRGIGEGLKAVIVNPVIILGAGDWNKSSSEIFKTAYNEFPWYTNGISGFVDVLDVVKACILLMQSNITAQRFILSAANLSYKDIFTQIANNFGKKPPHKKVTPLIAQAVWRLEAIKGKLTGKEPMLTKETSRTAQAQVHFSNSKLLQYLPGFTYTTLPTTIQRICNDLKQMHNL